MRWVGALLLVISALLTAQRAPVWRTDETLWTAAVRVSPTVRAMTNLAAALARSGQWEDADRWLQQAEQRQAETPGVVALRVFLCVRAGVCGASSP